MKDEQKRMCCVALWTFWNERNRIREGEQRRDPAWIARSIQVTVSEWRRQERQPTSVGNSRVPNWENPENDQVKVNCYAVYNPSTRNGGWDCILRDSEGDVVAALWGRLEALMNHVQVN